MTFNHGWFPILSGAAVVCFFMAVMWLAALKLKRFSIVDPAWTACMVFLAVWAYGFAPGSEFYRQLTLILVALWGGRLVRHLIQRLFKEKGEDTRYLKLRADWKNGLNLKFFLFFQVQAISTVILSWPYWLIASNSGTELVPSAMLGLGIWVIGFLGESIADGQLKNFKNNPANKGKVCDIGLWSVSRHPNYFFEWLMWIGYFLLGFHAPYGWTGIFSPILMFYLLRYGSGVPPAEEQSLKSKGDAYRRYQQTTSVFIPWPKKK